MKLASARPRTWTTPGAGSGEEAWDRVWLKIQDASCTKILVWLEMLASVAALLTRPDLQREHFATDDLGRRGRDPNKRTNTVVRLNQIGSCA